MAGPWDDYTQPTTDATSGPWSDYQGAAPVPQPIGMNPELGTPIYADDAAGSAANKAINEGQERAAEKVAEGATFGMLPYGVAAARSVAGTPFQQGLKEAQDYTNQTSKDYPTGSMLAEGVGSIGPTMGLYGLAKPAIAAAGKAIPYVGSALGNALFGAGIGGASSAAHDVGSGNTDNLAADTGKGAALGGVLSGVADPLATALQAVPNMVRGGISAVKSIGTGSGRDALAGQVLREATTGGDPSFANSLLPGMGVRTAQATGDPGIAALERTIAPAGVQNGRTSDQVSGLVKSLVGNDAGIEPAVLAGQASSNGVDALNAARAATKQAETSLWSGLNSGSFNGPGIAKGVTQDVAGMPASFRDAITGPNAKLNSFLTELHELPEGATIADINSVRSRLLGAARAARATGDNPTGAAAEQMAGSIMDRIGSDPAIVGAPARAVTAKVPNYPQPGWDGPTAVVAPAVQPNPELAAAYQAARDYTRQRAQTFGYGEFDNVFRPNSAGNVASNPQTAFGRFFDLSGGTGAGPDRLNSVVSLLRNTGTPEANAAADQLTTASQNYLKTGLLKNARAGNGVDQAGMPQYNLASLNSTINRQMPTISGTPMLAPVAPEVQGAGNAAELLNRPAASRGDMNSTTFEKLKNNDLVSAIIGQSGSSALGALGGGYAAGEYGPEEIPWYLRVPAGAAAGAFAGQRAAPYLGKAISSIPGLKSVVTGPTADIMSRVEGALASPQEYQRLVAAYMTPGPSLTSPGAITATLPALSRAAIPALTSGARP